MSQWRAVTNHVAQTTYDLELPPWSYANNRPEFDNKTDFRAWCARQETEHCFFSAVEPVNPTIRVNWEHNPPHKLHGFVVDYDGRVALDQLINNIRTDLEPGLQPTAIGKTFSGGARACWVFEEPIWVDNKALSKAVMKKLKQEFKAGRLAPGFDDASLDLTQFWELGTDWVVNPDAVPVPRHITLEAQFSASLAIRRATNEVTIPLDVIREEIEKQYPGRIMGRFEKGTRIPLFWIDDGRQDLSAIVADWGVYSFSTRSDKGSMTWADLLGANFVRQFEQRRIEQAIDPLWYDGKRYWEKSPDGFWFPEGTDTKVQDLKVKGYSNRMPNQEETSSEIDKILYNVRTLKRVSFAAPIPHSKRDVVVFNSERYLNTMNKPPCLMAPEGEGVTNNFPWLFEFFDNFLDRYHEDEVDPKFYFMAELQRAYQGLMAGEARSGHVMLLAGPTGRGKSFLTTKILRYIFGSASDAGPFLLSGGDAFNKSLAESYIWYVDDNRSASNMMEHARFSEAIKKHAATPEILYHAKYTDATSIPWYGRIVITCNEDPESIAIVPNLDINILDKICLFRIAHWKANFLPNDEMEALVRRELPFFLRWLHDVFDPKAFGVKLGEPRYGVEAYHHGATVELAQEGSMELKDVETFDFWRDKFAIPTHRDQNGYFYWLGTSTVLFSEMSCQESLWKLTKDKNVRTFGKVMSKLYKSNRWEPLCNKTTNESKTSVWWIRLKECPHSVRPDSLPFLP